jgi:Tol biopolymer transport system component
MILAGAACGAGKQQTDRPASKPTSAPQILLTMGGVGGATDLWLVQADGDGLRNLTRTEDEEYAPSWSPDGKRIVFQRQYASGEQIGGDDLFVLDVESGQVEALVVSDAEENYPAWSPNGSRIAFVSNQDAVSGAIYTIRSDGTDLKLIGARDRMPESLTWSPEGDRIAFSSNVGPGDDLRIHVMDSDGGNVTSISKGDIDHEPVWSPRRDEILFNRGFDLIAVNPETHAERALGVMGISAAWYDERGSVLVDDADGLRLVDPSGKERLIMRTRTRLLWGPPATRP